MRISAPRSFHSRITRAVRRLGLGALVLLTAVASATGSETGLKGDEGHPRARFPLSIYVAPMGEASLDEAVARAVQDWNALFRDLFGTPAFRDLHQDKGADVVVAMDAASGKRLMGEAHLDVEHGVIVPPVHIDLFAPTAKGQTSRELVLYQVVAHELGHALGLPHSRDPRSLMCCEMHAIDFSDPVAREAYIEARRHPDVRSVRNELAQHYERFWQKHADGR